MTGRVEMQWEEEGGYERVRVWTGGYRLDGNRGGGGGKWEGKDGTGAQ